jgi:hypothetical protein
VRRALRQRRVEDDLRQRHRRVLVPQHVRHRAVPHRLELDVVDVAALVAAVQQDVAVHVVPPGAHQHRQLEDRFLPSRVHMDDDLLAQNVERVLPRRGHLVAQFADGVPAEHGVGPGELAPDRPRPARPLGAKEHTQRSRGKFEEVFQGGDGGQRLGALGPGPARLPVAQARGRHGDAAHREAVADPVETEPAGLDGDAQRSVERPCAKRFGELGRHRHTLSLDSAFEESGIFGTRSRGGDPSQPER